MHPHSPSPWRTVLAALALPALALFWAPACTSTPAPESPPAIPITTEEALGDFEAAWSTIDETYFDPDFNGLDWQAVHDEIRPRVEAATTVREVRSAIEEMLGRLGQSHFGLIPSDALPPSTGGGDGRTPEGVEGGLGLDFRLREDRLLITEVRRGGPAEVAGVRRGWILLAIDGRPLDELLAKFAASGKTLGPRKVASGVRGVFLGRTHGKIGGTVELTLLDDGDREVRLEIPRGPREVIAHAAASTLPTFYLEFDDEILEREGRRFGRIHFTNWFLPMAPMLDEAIDRMRSGDGIVLDLRGNSGGVLMLCMGLAGHFFDEKMLLGTMQYQSSKLKFVANPRRVNPAHERVTPFAGPLAILIDETSGSASEVFAGGLQSVGRARVFGETSAGAVLPAMTTALPSGDAILHAMANFKTADGTLLEERGVIPDEPVPLDRETLLEGRDPQLEAALAWLARQAPPRPAGHPLK
jgi:carboxyl-terminal processing protease